MNYVFMSDTEEPFQMVKRKRCKKKHKGHTWLNSSYQEPCHLDNDMVDSRSVLEKLHNCRLKLQQTSYIQNLVDCFVQCQLIVDDTISNKADATLSTCDPAPSEDKPLLGSLDGVVAYGVGHFSTCPVARFQFALLLLLIDMLKVPKRCCFVYDPVFSSAEKALVSDLGLQLLKVNEEGKRQSLRRTLYYMPHCGKPLYNNLLWANWRPDRLANTVLLGNSFKTMLNSVPSRILQEHFPYIYKILPHTVERELRGLPSDLRDVFNDMSLQWFSTHDASLADEFWTDAGEPNYCGNEFDQEIIWTIQSRSCT